MNLPVPVDISPYQTAYSTAQPLSQCSLTHTINQISYLGLLLLLLTISCFCFNQWHQKRRQHRPNICRRQQIESLEKVWRMTAYQKPWGDSMQD